MILVRRLIASERPASAGFLMLGGTVNNQIKRLSEELAQSIAKSIQAKMDGEGITLMEFMDLYDLAIGWIESTPEPTHKAPKSLQ